MGQQQQHAHPERKRFKRLFLSHWACWMSAVPQLMSAEGPPDVRRTACHSQKSSRRLYLSNLVPFVVAAIRPDIRQPPLSHFLMLSCMVRQMSANTPHVFFNIDHRR